MSLCSQGYGRLVGSIPAEHFGTPIWMQRAKVIIQKQVQSLPPYKKQGTFGRSTDQNSTHRIACS